jgi:hypothetical protein
MKFNKDSAYGFVVCAALGATSFAIGANFRANPGREYFDACIAFQAEEAAAKYYPTTVLEKPSPNDERNAKHTIRFQHWLGIMESFEPDNEAVKEQLKMLNETRKHIPKR